MARAVSTCPVPEFARLVLASIDDVFAQAMKIQNWLNQITKIFSKLQAWACFHCQHLRGTAANIRTGSKRLDLTRRPELRAALPECTESGGSQQAPDSRSGMFLFSSCEGTMLRWQVTLKTGDAPTINQALFSRSAVDSRLGSHALLRAWPCPVPDAAENGLPTELHPFT